MAANRIRITVEGDPRDDGHVRLSDFLRQLDSVRKALRYTEGLLQTGEKAVYYRIIEARRQSPLTVTLEAVTEKPSHLPVQVVGKFLDSIDQIKKRGQIPSDFDYPTAEAYREITIPQRQHVSALIIGNGRRRIAIDHQYEERITKAIGPDEFAEGSITGTLDTVKLHHVTAFEVFPTIGPKRVVCHFRPDIKERSSKPWNDMSVCMDDCDISIGISFPTQLMLRIWRFSPRKMNCPSSATLKAWPLISLTA
jgi:hypothetical protein